MNDNQEAPIDLDLYNKYLAESIRYHFSSLKGGTENLNCLEFYHHESPEVYDPLTYEPFQEFDLYVVLSMCDKMAEGFYTIGAKHE